MKKWLAVIVALFLIMAALGVLADDPAVDVSVTVTFGQTEARSMLTMINTFRKSSDAWYYEDETNTKKKYCTNLSDLIYDYTLEKVAMQRAAEIALYYVKTHTRPNGEDCFTAYPKVRVSAENLAHSQESAQEAFICWREDDELYEGQGHRRNMLNSDCTHIGIGHAIYNGVHFWTHAIAAPLSPNTTVTAAVDSERTYTVPVAPALVSGVKCDATQYTLTAGESQNYPAVSFTMRETPYNTYFPYISAGGKNPVQWSSSNTNVVGIQNGKFVAKNAGSAKLTGTVLGKTVEIPVKVYPLDGTKVKQTLSFASDSVVKTYGDASFINPLTGAKTSVTYTVSSGTDVAEVSADGTVSIKAAGTAVITAEAADTETVNGAGKTYTLTVNKAEWVITTPQPKTGLIYNGYAMDLVTAGSVNGGTMLYAVTNDIVIPDETKYSSSVPQRTDVGTYYVWFKVNGDNNHNATKNFYFPDPVTISPSPIETFTVTFDSAGGSEVQALTVEKGKTAARPADPVKTGYSFVGWMLNDQLYDWASPVTGNLHLVAQWKEEVVPVETFTVTFDSVGGSEVQALTVEKGKTAARPADPVRTGYSFVGWMLNDQLYDWALPVTGNFHLVAQWKEEVVPVETFTVTFDSVGGSEVQALTVEKGKTAVRPADPVRPGYTFVTWLHNMVPYDFMTSVNTDLRLTAQWKEEVVPVETFTVTFDSVGGSLVPEQKVEIGKTAVRPADPVRPGYTFVTWLHNMVPYDFMTSVNTDLKLTAQWKEEEVPVETFTVTFDTAGGSLVPEQKVEKGKTAARPADPVRSGYTFVTWLHNLVPYDFTTYVNTDLILTAQWNADSTYIYRVGDGSSWTKYSGMPLIFRIENTANELMTFDKFKSINIDGNRVDPSNYKVKRGSVIIELQPSYLETLNAGEHRITAEFEDGMAEAKFTVDDNAVTPASLPQTGDTKSPLIYGLFALIACIGLGLIIKRK